MTERTKIVCAVPECPTRLWSHHVRAGETKCGLHQIEEQGFARTELPGAIPAHFNEAIGEWVEGRDDWKKKMDALVKDGTLAGYG